MNGQLKQSGTTSDLIFDIPTLVSHMSQSLTPRGRGGDLDRDPSGVGFARTPPEFLASGDVVTLEIEGIGRMTNPVEAS